ncbi:hypothetical protein INR76_06420 [Marixanthomonas sp. SCSIO 43207]|uniref:hypothetical protein n=1 Tax=Marixanthomonas sp. SCSIO 43207 TaxID=2779360 RepID=UPI001CAA0130|nr:hypothetical protein [Marixanthomonas sp. SCSIO 43207]UAB82390.1 hypothetical protein INR76_06420 [Marixanthomonas sp. SCSIO 43207]
MKNGIVQLTLIGLTILLFGCTTVSQDDLIVSSPILEVVTYNKNIEPIIHNNCIICHSNPPENGAPMPLMNYENVKEAIQNRNLLSRISSEDPALLMPPGGPKLPQNLVELIVKWKEGGLIKE